MSHSCVYTQTLVEQLSIHPTPLVFAGANPRSTIKQTISHTFTPIEAEGLGDSTQKVLEVKAGLFLAERANSIIFQFLHGACC